MHYTTIFQSAPSRVVMHACAQTCLTDCKDYTTPLRTCYSPSKLFPGDIQWGTVDLYDRYSDSKHAILRTMYASSNGTCQGITDTVSIPIGVNVSPLGDPRPCGSFTLL